MWKCREPEPLKLCRRTKLRPRPSLEDGREKRGWLTTTAPRPLLTPLLPDACSSPTHRRSLSCTYTHTLLHSCTHTLPHTLTLAHSHTHSCTHTQYLYIQSLVYKHACSLSHTHTHPAVLMQTRQEPPCRPYVDPDTCATRSCFHARLYKHVWHKHSTR